MSGENVEGARAITKGLFFWVDTEVLKTKTNQATIDDAVEEIWGTYFEMSKLDVDPEILSKVSDQFKLGRPYPTNLFDPVSAVVYQNAATYGDFPTRVKNFATATVYKKRVSGLYADPPDFIFDECVKMQDDLLWREIHSNKDQQVDRNSDTSLRHYPVNFREKLHINCKIDDLVDLWWDITKCQEVYGADIKLLESLSPNTQVYYSKLNLIVTLSGVLLKFQTGPCDFVQWISKRIMPDGHVYILLTSIDHVAAPVGKLKRGEVALGVNRARVIDSNTCEAMTWYIGVLTNGFANFVLSFDWPLIKTLCRYLLKHMIEKNDCIRLKRVRKFIEGKK